MKITGAQAILQVFKRENVDLIFGYPGGAIMPLYDALHDFHADIQHVLVRHEQGAVHAAEGYSRVTGKTGVCVVTSGPGATNIVTGIADAMLDSIPLVCITGQVNSKLIGTDAFQEADIVGMTLTITKWSYQITCAEEIPEVLAKAFYIAQNGRPGPILIDVTKDAQLQLFDFSYQSYKPQKIPVHQKLLCNEKIKNAVALINQAKKPYLLVGHGVLIAKAEQLLLEFAEKTGIPVACTLLGLSAFPVDHPLYVGLLGMHGNYGTNCLTNEADLIIAIGMRFDDRVTGNLSKYAKQAQVIHIDIDPAEINKNVLTTVSLISDAKEALQQLLTQVEPRQHGSWLDQFKEYYAIEHNQIVDKEINASGNSLKMAEVIHLLSDKTKGQAILVTDVGQHQMVAARYYQFNCINSHITSGGLGTMGFALPAAIGVKLAKPNREVIVIVGDGGFQMNIQELGVIMQEKLSIKIIILNNSYLGMVRQWQELFHAERYSFTALQNPDFVKIADGYCIPGEKVEERQQLSNALDRMLAARNSYLLEIKVEKQEKVFPMIPSGAGVGEIRLS